MRRSGRLGQSYDCFNVEGTFMRRLVIGVSVLALAALAALAFAPAPSGAVHPDFAAASAATCSTKHCSANTHCCYSCTGSPICIKNGVPCPECAPQ
jgi:hypothetical protein